MTPAESELDRAIGEAIDRFLSEKQDVLRRGVDLPPEHPVDSEMVAFAFLGATVHRILSWNGLAEGERVLSLIIADVARHLSFEAAPLVVSETHRAVLSARAALDRAISEQASEAELAPLYRAFLEALAARGLRR